MATRKFVITEKKPVYDEWFASLDLSEWLGTEEISNVAFEGFDITDGAHSATAATGILDQAKCTFTTTVVKPWIQKGSHGNKYRIRLQVTTNENAQGEFYIDFKAQNLLTEA